jgi:N-acetylated-alpha-linked acidic dipeptidase
MASYTASELNRQALNIGIKPLGSGSDFTVFLQHLGVSTWAYLYISVSQTTDGPINCRRQIASMDQAFEDTPSDAAYHYHSVYDSQHWQEQYADPGFHRHVSHCWDDSSNILTSDIQVAVAKHLGLMTLRLTDAIVLPLNTTQYVLELHHYLDQWVL